MEEMYAVEGLNRIFQAEFTLDSAGNFALHFCASFFHNSLKLNTFGLLSR